MIVLVAGARPNYPKVAAIYAALKAADHDVRLVDTGQHYEPALASEMREDLELPVPDAFLGVGSGQHAPQTARIMERFNVAIGEWRPEAVVVVGDVNSTLACALVTAKAWDAEGRRPLLVHVEAGLRSFDRTMPEEVNRVVTDALSDLLFTTEFSGNMNLLREGIDGNRVHLVGNVMVDTLFKFAKRHGYNSGGAVVATLHRPSTVDRLEVLAEVMGALVATAIIAKREVLLVAHPRTRPQIQEAISRGLLADFPPSLVTILPALRYKVFIEMVNNARLVMTDSGGLQEETTALGIPCLTLRETTERPVTVTQGTNLVVGTNALAITNAVRQEFAQPTQLRALPQFWDGLSAERIRIVLERTLSYGRR